MNIKKNQQNVAQKNVHFLITFHFRHKCNFINKTTKPKIGQISQFFFSNIILNFHIFVPYHHRRRRNHTRPRRHRRRCRAGRNWKHLDSCHKRHRRRHRLCPVDSSLTQTDNCPEKNPFAD